FRFLASRYSCRPRMIPYFVNTRTSGLRLRTLSRTYPLSPLITETTATTVMTPMITPRSVRNERSLLRRSAWNETWKSSDKLTSALVRALSRAFLLFLFHHDLVAVLDRPQGLERTRHDFLAGGHTRFHLDRQLAGQSRRDAFELDLAVLQGVGPLFGLDLAGR